jgi:hypothetical protein
MFGMGYYGEYERESQRTPLQKCKETYIALRLEQKKREPDPSILSRLNLELYEHDDATRTAAFNAVVDEQGW